MAIATPDCYKAKVHMWAPLDMIPEAEPTPKPGTESQPGAGPDLREPR